MKKALPPLRSKTLDQLLRAIESVREARMLTVGEFVKEVGWGRTVYYNLTNDGGLSEKSMWKAKAWLRKNLELLEKKKTAATRSSQ